MNSATLGAVGGWLSSVATVILLHRENDIALGICLWGGLGLFGVILGRMADHA